MGSQKDSLRILLGLLQRLINLVPRACDPWEGNEGSGIIRCRKPGIVAKIELRIHFNGQSESSLKRIIPEPSFPSRGSQARGTRLAAHNPFSYPEPFLRAVNGRRRGALAKSISNWHLIGYNEGYCSNNVYIFYHVFMVSGFGFGQSPSSHRA